MTGYGEGRYQSSGLDIVAELRSINNRHLKLSIRVTEGYSALEPVLEDYLRQRLRRGTVQATVRVRRQASPEDYRINPTVLRGYRDQLDRMGEPPSLTSLLLLPGVVETGTALTADVDAIWPMCQLAVNEALDRLNEMRRREGESMARDLVANLKQIALELEDVRQRIPHVVSAYQNRLSDRINQILLEYDVRVQPSDVVREVGFFADRIDTSEEIVRLRSHLQQAEAIMAERESAGRKLDFLVQEMFREANTIGSKANDAEIARRVVEMKTVIERIREMVQNVE
jgi:uncharacterized protein (TIGR00255 family)